jgi:hypothetical protein
MAVLEDAIRFLDNLGVWDVILPFILVFTVVYAVLEKTKVFGTEDGKPKHRFNAVAALVVSLMAIVSASIVGVISNIMQYLVVFVFAVLFIAIILGLLGFKELKPNIVLPIALLVIAGLALYLLGYFGFIDFVTLRKYGEGPLIILLLLLFLGWFILRPSKKGEPQPY